MLEGSSQLSAITLFIVLVYLSGRTLLVRFAGIASNNLRNRFVLFAELLRISGFVSFVVLLVVEDTKKAMLLDIGKIHNTVILLNWKLNAFGIMLETTMFTGLFNQRLMGNWLS